MSDARSNTWYHSSPEEMGFKVREVPPVELQEMTTLSTNSPSHSFISRKLTRSQILPALREIGETMPMGLAVCLLPAGPEAVREFGQTSAAMTMSQSLLDRMRTTAKVIPDLVAQLSDQRSNKTP